MGLRLGLGFRVRVRHCEDIHMYVFMYTICGVTLCVST